MSRTKLSDISLAPTVVDPWWGRLLPLQAVGGRTVMIIAMTMIGLGLALAGCAKPYRPACKDPVTLTYQASTDSIGLAEFLELPDADKQARRRLAKRWLDDARKQDAADIKVQALTNAAGLTPDDPEPWLQLADIWRWLGLYLKSVDCLDRSAAAIRELSGADWEFERGRNFRRNVVQRTMLIRAWLHYDRAEWSEGLNWAEGAARLDLGTDDTMQILGLLKGRAGYWSHAQEISRDIRRRNPENTDSHWVRAMSEAGVGRFEEARFSGPRSDRPHAAEAWRDRGRLAERLHEWSDALYFYRHSAAEIPLHDPACVTTVNVRLLDPTLSRSELPVWLSFGRYYLTGSLSAYVRLALDNFDRHLDGSERDFWATAVINGAGICLREGMDEAWALRARGLVFAQTGMPDLGLADLAKASSLLGEGGYTDIEMEAALGHMLLMKEDHLAALPHLRRTVEFMPADAVAWSDLGLALIMTGDTEAAAEALSRAIELEPSLATAWYNRGLMHLHAKQLEAAEIDLREAARLAPGNPEVGQLLQQIHVLRQQADQSQP